MDELRKAYVEREKVKVRGVIPGAIVGSWVEGFFYFYNEFQPPGREYAVHVPQLGDMVYVSPEQVSKWGD